jgi:hypothetical protein
MTKYTTAYFDATPGMLEQLVLAVVTQKLSNASYLPSNLETDFTTDSVDWNVTLDANGSGENQATLNLSITFITSPYARQILSNREGFEQRVVSYNSNSIDGLALNRESSYPINSYPVQYLPAYLLDNDHDQNTLERRMMWLCLQIQAVQNWISRWNNLARLWQLRNYSTSVVLPPDMTIDQLNIKRDLLLSQLSAMVPTEFTTEYSYDVTPLAESALSESTYYESPGYEYPGYEYPGYESPGDPANNDPSSYLPSSLLDSLQSQSSEYGSSSPDSDRPSRKEPEENQPTLPDC